MPNDETNDPPGTSAKQGLLRLVVIDSDGKMDHYAVVPYPETHKVSFIRRRWRITLIIMALAR